MKSFFDYFFANNFLPHGHSYFWQADILWSHALADGIIAATYFTIPVLLLHIFRKWNKIRYSWMIGLLAIFIIGGGLTHAMDVIIIWLPLYRLDSAFRIITAFASLGTAITLIKITPTMLSNEELQATNEKLQAVNDELAARNHFIERVTDTTPNSIYIFDLHLLKTVYHNKDAFQTIGYSQAEIYAMGADAVKKLVHPEDIEKRFDYYRNFVTASEAEIREVEFRIRHANGLYRWFLVRSTVFRRNAEGIPNQVISISQDITALKETENRLHQALFEVQTTNEKLNANNEELYTLNETLVERNHFIEKVTETTPNTIFVFDLQGFKTVYVSKDILQTLGYSREELYAMGSEAMKKMAYPDDLERRNDFYRNFVTASEEEIRELEYRTLHADGSYRWLLVRGTVFRKNAQGIPDQMIGITQDITALKELENNLRQALLQVQTTNADLSAASEEIQAANEATTSANENLQTLNETLIQRNHFIEQVTDTTPNSIYIFDLHLFKTIYVSKDIFQSLGYSAEEIYAFSTETIKKLVHPEDYEKRLDYYRNFITASEEEIRDVEYRVRHANGSYHWFLIRSTVFRRNTEGIPDQIIGNSQDITAIKETEADLRNTLAQLTEANKELSQTQQMLLQANQHLKESEETARLLTEGVQDYAILMLTPEGKIGSWNIGAQRIKGYQAEEIIGEHFSKFYLAEAIANKYPEYELKKAQEEGRFEDEGWRVRKDKSTYWANVLITALYNPQKKLIGYSEITRDLTQKVKNEELTQKNKALVTINADLDNFIYAASHDLKSPITNLEGLLTLLRKKLALPATSENAQVVSMMEVSINRLKKTILDISEISQVQKGLEEAYETLNFAQLLDEIKADMTDLIAQSEATIRTNFQVEQMDYARKNLRSILYNLLSNALKYRSLLRPAVVELSTFFQNGQLVLTVRDNGLGLSEKQQSKLFSMFKRMHSHVDGTGIGLYMIKRMVENNGGKITVDSQPDVGSAFTVYFKG
ncbi:MAG: PAS domain S-box protein [Bacteroidota bacterium]